MLKINEIFFSIQGESSFAGLPCVFVRLTGCNLRCAYCDTSYAFEEGTDRTPDSVWEEARHYSCRLVEITGGEPLLQHDTPELAHGFVDRGWTVLVETNGSFDIDPLPNPIIRIMDIKCPSSGCEGQNDWKNMERLRPRDEVKFVIQDRNDFEWASHVVERYRLAHIANVLFSPVVNGLKPHILAEWILKEQTPVRIQLQLQRILWPNAGRGR